MSEYDDNGDSVYFKEENYQYDDISGEKIVRRSKFKLSHFINFIAFVSIILLAFYFNRSLDTSLIKGIFYVCVLTVVGTTAYSLYKKINTHLTVVTKCTQLVNAQCISVIPVKYISDNRFTYHPAYRYIWKGVKYSVTIGKTETKRKKGEIYPIMINPSDPLMIYDPFVQRRKTLAVAAEAIMEAIPPLALLAVLFVFFKYA